MHRIRIRAWFGNVLNCFLNYSENRKDMQVNLAKIHTSLMASSPFWTHFVNKSIMHFSFGITTFNPKGCRIHKPDTTKKTNLID